LTAPGPRATHVPDLRSLEAGSSRELIFRAVSGSRAYGTSRPGSDTDIRGVFVLPALAYLATTPPLDQVADPRGDIVYYSLRRFVELAASANPNILELLFLPEDCILFRSRAMDLVISQRSLFVTREAFASHVGYAQAQIKRARGQNKWVNNPQPAEPPRRESFCWVIPRASVPGGSPYRPVPLEESGVALEECHCAAVEHVRDAYRLYHYGPNARGVFRSGVLVCESIPLEDEDARCLGLLLYGRNAYEQAMRDHRSYWEWRRHRNEARWLSQERGETDYDAKNMMHTFRLLLSGSHILRHHEPLVRLAGEELRFLQQVLAGHFTYDELIRRAEDLVRELEALHAASTLPEKADAGRVNALLHEATRLWETDRG
jgi:hypothetical protein